MRAPVRLAAFVAGLGVLFGAAMGVGEAVGPVGQPADDHAGDGPVGAGHGGAGPADPVPGGLQVSADGYTLEVEQTRLDAGTEHPVRFAITDRHGDPVTGFALEHDRRMHVIVVRRDLTGYQHLHPRMSPDGTWRLPLRLDRPGSYRLFADFRPAGGAAGVTLGTDLMVAGRLTPEPLGEPNRVSRVGSYAVTRDGELPAGDHATLRLRVARDGVGVTDLQRYLGAYGHLVVLRAGDLAFLHVHPIDSRSAGPNVDFDAEVPSVGTYRLFFDFQHEGRVRTATFTVHATPKGDDSDEHDR